MTIAETFEEMRRALQHDSAFEADEAHVATRLLLDAATGVRHSHLMEPRRELSAEREKVLEKWLEEAQNGRPIAYIVGQREFYGLTFQCDERALIPRPETEMLVDAAVDRLQTFEKAKIADLGTGSGCIAVSLAHALPQATIYATDRSPDALELATENAARHAVTERIRFISGNEDNWAEPLRQWQGDFDAIISNPPYIARDEIAALQREIREWEPHLALVAGEDGLDCYRRIASQCRPLLRSEGFLLVELGAGQFEAAEQIFTAQGWDVEAPLHDLAGIARVLCARPE